MAICQIVLGCCTTTQQISDLCRHAQLTLLGVTDAEAADTYVYKLYVTKITNQYVDNKLHAVVNLPILCTSVRTAVSQS
jgi:hypothetical protein